LAEKILGTAVTIGTRQHVLVAAVQARALAVVQEMQQGVKNKALYAQAHSSSLYPDWCDGGGGGGGDTVTVWQGAVFMCIRGIRFMDGVQVTATQKALLGIYPSIRARRASQPGHPQNCTPQLRLWSLIPLPPSSPSSSVVALAFTTGPIFAIETRSSSPLLVQGYPPW